MSGITAKVVCDSVSPSGSRLTTMELRYPRIIHAEFMTHRAFSRNAESSRARPFDAMVDAVLADPFVPLVWGSEKSGMQAGPPLTGKDRDTATLIWLDALNRVVAQARELRSLEQRVHKSLVNRLLEPWAYITVVCTATEWSNFFRLRLHGDAEPHFQALAGAMKAALDSSVPTVRDGHFPYFDGTGFSVDLGRFPSGMINLVSFAAECTTIDGVTDQSVVDFVDRCVQIDGPLGRGWDNLMAMVSVARCSRVSYLKQGRVPTLVEDLAQYDRLVTGSGFGHWSPHEHVGFAGDKGAVSGNFVGWTQYRKLFVGRENG